MARNEKIKKWWFNEDIQQKVLAKERNQVTSYK